MKKSDGTLRQSVKTVDLDAEQMIIGNLLGATLARVNTREDELGILLKKAEAAHAINTLRQCLRARQKMGIDREDFATH